MQTDPNLSEGSVFFEEQKPQPQPQLQINSIVLYSLIAAFLLLLLVGVYVGYSLGLSQNTAPSTSVVQDEVKVLDEVENMETVTPESQTLLSDGTYAVARFRHVSDNEWFDASVIYSPDRGYTWERVLSISDGFIMSRVYVLQDTVYFAVTKGMDSFSSADINTSFYQVDLSKKAKTELGTVEGYASDFGVTPQGIIAVVPERPSCLDKPTNCTSEVSVLEGGTATAVAEVEGIWLSAYGHNGLVMMGGYGDAGCRSVELYHYEGHLVDGVSKVDEFKNGSCFGDVDNDQFEILRERALTEFSEGLSPYYESEDGDAFSLETVDGSLMVSAKEVEADRMELMSDEIESAYESPITVLRYPDVSIDAVSEALNYFDAPAQTSIPDFNLDEDPYPRDMLYADGGSGKTMPMSEVQKYNRPEYCMVVRDNHVHDITALLRFGDTYVSLAGLRERCGGDVSEFINAMPVVAGSLNTARFAYVLSQFWIGYSVED